MPGVAIDEVVNCTNPLLQFFYQEKGKLKDINSLSFSVTRLSDKAVVYTSPSLNLDPCDDGGLRLGTGRYAADFDATDYEQGTHQIVWSYVVDAGGPTKKWAQNFEVLDNTEFISGLGFRMYSESYKLINNSSFLGASVGDIQQIGQEIAVLIEELTGRYFEPRFLDVRLNSSGAGAIPLMEPVVGIESVSFVGGGSAQEFLTIDNESIVVYNRHLQTPSTGGGGSLSEQDDRDNPRIEFVTDLVPGISSTRVLTQGRFLPGRQTVRVKGVFGYTEPNGTPIGTTSNILKRVSGIMLLRKFLDPFAQDVSISQPARIREARTRDQQIKYGGAADSSIGPITGDRTIDDLLILLMRPPYFVATGDRMRMPVKSEHYDGY